MRLYTFDGACPAAEQQILKNMFEARRRVFVDLLGWKVPVLEGIYEIDQFDDVHAVYLVITDGELQHLASARLLPTTRPHILGSLYPGLCDAGVPRGPDVKEISRFCLDPRIGAAGRRAARNMLVSALADYAVPRAIARYTGVAGPAWLRQILAFGWRSRTLGEPRDVNGELLGALAIDIDAQTPGLLLAHGIYTPAPEPEARHAA